MQSLDLPDDETAKFLFPSPPPAAAAPPETPRFLHHNIEASHQLGLPDSPTIHLAVTTVANLLMPLADGARASVEVVRITALRVASGTVLECRPIECAWADFLDRVDLPADHAASELAYRTKLTDWLGQARAMIEAAGDDPGPDARRMATRYGWDPLRE